MTFTEITFSTIVTSDVIWYRWMDVEYSLNVQLLNTVSCRICKFVVTEISKWMIKFWAHSETRCTLILVKFRIALVYVYLFIFWLGCCSSLFYESCPHLKILWAFPLRVDTTFPYQKPSGAFNSQVWLNAPRDVDLRVVHTGIRPELVSWGVRLVYLIDEKRPILVLFIFSENICICVTSSFLWREVRHGLLLSKKDVDYKYLQVNN